jgi:UDP-N-acetylglucosamine--N-acetylmuramyl-(pentapeptide) pyrophosphoryl-undecaprenol N-acetylglucosamine transferase
MTLAEITAMACPSILVPYPYATDDHQTANARSLVEAGAARLVPDSEMNGERLFAELEDLLANKESLASMAELSRKLGRPEAANRIVAAMENLLVPPAAR